MFITRCHLHWPRRHSPVGKALGGLFDNDITGLAVVERTELMED